eukprot:Em0001g2008a
MYRMYLKTGKVQLGQNVVCKSLFRKIVQHITGGGIKQDARAGVDYVKVNYHTDNFALVDMVIKILMACAQPDELLYQRNLEFDFLSYGYSQHVMEGVKAQYEAAGNMEPLEHNISLQEKQQFHQYKELHSMGECPDDFDNPDKQHAFIGRVKTQLNVCAEIHGHTGIGATSHTPSYTFDLAKDYAPRTDHQKDFGKEAMPTMAKKNEEVTLDGENEEVTLDDENEEVTLDGENEEVTLDGENEEVTLDDENEEVTLDDENEEVTLDGENEEVTLDGENEEVTLDGENEEVILDDENEEVTLDDENEEVTLDVTLDGENEEVTLDGENEEVTLDGENEEVTLDDENEEVTLDDENEEVTLDGENEEVTLDGENEEVTLDDENEEVTLDGENEEVTLDDENEEVTLDDENEEVTLDDENEEVTLDDENEEVTLDGENEEVTLDDENEEVALDVTLDDENEEVALDGENEEVTLDDENEEVTLDGENEEVTLDGENEEVTLDDENEEVTLDGENEEVTLDGENEEVTLDGENEEVTLDGENEEVTLDGENEEVTLDDENEEVTLDDENEEVTLDDENEEVTLDVANDSTFPMSERAAGLEYTGYYHNEAGTGKDEHTNKPGLMHTLMKAVVEGRCRLLSIAAALAAKLIKNTTVLLLKPDFKAPFCTSTLKTISGIAGFYASEYITTGGIAQQVTTLNLFRNMGQYIPSKTVTLSVIQPASMDVKPFQQQVLTLLTLHHMLHLNVVFNVGGAQEEFDYLSFLLLGKYGYPTRPLGSLRMCLADGSGDSTHSHFVTVVNVAMLEEDINHSWACCTIGRAQTMHDQYPSSLKGVQC